MGFDLSHSYLRTTIWSADDVACVMNPSTQKLQVVHITPEEHEKHRHMHVSVGAAKDEERQTEAQNVVVKIFNLVNAEGARGAITTKLLDHNFSWPGNPDQYMGFYEVNRQMQLYVACVNKSHPLYDEIEYFAEMFVIVVIPYIKKHRTERQQAAGSSVKVMSSQSSASQPSQIILELDADTDRIIFTMDGHYPGIEAIIRRVGRIMQDHGIEVFKWAGGCTITQQPADVADTHKEVHKAAADEIVKYDESGAPTDLMQEFIDYLPNIGASGARLHTHQKFLRHLEWIVDRAWNKRGITEAWRVSGLWPVCPEKILSGWGGWETIPTENAKQIVALCTDLDGDAFHEIAKDKFLDDLKAHTIFGHLIEDDDYKLYMSDKEPTVTPSNQRCLMMNSVLFDNDCSYMQKQWEKREADAARLLAAHGAIVEGVQMCVCGLKLPKDVAKHLECKVHETRCRRLNIWRGPVPEEGVADVAAAVPAPVLEAPAVPEGSEERVFEQEELL